jgi:hypothetical protein
MQKQGITTTINNELPLVKASSDCWLVLLDAATKPIQLGSHDVPTFLDLATYLAINSIFYDRVSVPRTPYPSQVLSKNCRIKQMKSFSTQIEVDLSKKSMYINSAKAAPKRKCLCYSTPTLCKNVRSIKKFKVEKVPNSMDKAQNPLKSSVIATYLIGTFLLPLLAIYCFSKA